MTQNIRVRWAPSNTGADIHVGNLRTILFNYLFAKKNGGTTVFRIEDSDIARSKPEYADAIGKTLDWIGLRADEGYNIGGDFGPYLQTAKLNRYKQVAEELIERRLAYRCYCSKDEMDVLRNQLPENKRQTFRYPGICRDRKDQPKNKDYCVRLKAPTEGSVEWDDMVFKKIVVPNKENYDWVIMRANGIPNYNMGCAVDDYDQKITHVIRGRDHIINTNIQIILHQMLGTHNITYSHLPMMMSMNNNKLSKRDGDVSVSDYQKKGYSKHSILNYLVKFGWGMADKELFSLEEMIDCFDLNNVGKNDGKFDSKKFIAINVEHLKSPTLTPDQSYAQHLSPFLSSLGHNLTVEQIIPLIPLVRTRSKTFVEAANELDPILRNDITIDQAAKEKLITPEVKYKLSIYNNLLETIEVWTEDNIRAATNWWLTANNLVLKDIGQPTRLAIVGRTNSPELFQTMAAIGKDVVMKRIADIINV